MANKDAAFGFRPTRQLSGGDIRTEEFAIAANYGTAIYTGQVVEAVAGGGVEAAAAGDTQQAGVFGGVFYTDPSTSKPTWNAYYPASTNASDLKASIYLDPNIIFEAQHDGTGTAAMNNSGFDFVGVGGSTISGQSTSELILLLLEHLVVLNKLVFLWTQIIVIQVQQTRTHTLCSTLVSIS